MELAGEAKRFGEHENAFGFLRLLFASLVIVSHSYETADGGNVNEPLHRLFGTISFGTLSVYAFFVISGYLITSSFVNSKTALDYLVKRMARIYPGFIGASLVCLFVVAPLGGQAGPSGKALAAELVDIAILHAPRSQAVFAGSFYPVLNGAMWTIAYEFRCYLLVLVLGVFGALRKPLLIAALAVLMLVFAKATPDHIAHGFDTMRGHVDEIFGQFRDSLTFFAVFLGGSTFYLFRHHIAIRSDLAIVSLASLAAGLCSAISVEVACAVFGGYLIFYTAYLGAKTFLKNVNNKQDFSYGVYLYGWPSMKIVQMYVGLRPVWHVFALAFVVSLVMGMLSWWGVEKPALQWARAVLSGHAKAAA